MNTLELATKVANNPHVMRMVAKQEAMWRRFVADYGNDFYVANYEGVEVPEAEQNLTRFPGVRGVTRWTVEEERQYNTLTARLAAYRKTLRELYSDAA